MNLVPQMPFAEVLEKNFSTRETRLSSCQEDIFQWRVLNYNFKHFFSETLIASQVALAEPGHNVEAEQQWSAILQRSNKAPGSLVY